MHLTWCSCWLISTTRIKAWPVREPEGACGVESDKEVTATHGAGDTVDARTTGADAIEEAGGAITVENSNWADTAGASAVRAAVLEGAIGILAAESAVGAATVAGSTTKDAARALAIEDAVAAAVVEDAAADDPVAVTVVECIITEGAVGALLVVDGVGVTATENSVTPDIGGTGAAHITDAVAEDPIEASAVKVVVSSGAPKEFEPGSTGATAVKDIAIPHAVGELATKDAVGVTVADGAVAPDAVEATAIADPGVQDAVGANATDDAREAFNVSVVAAAFVVEVAVGITSIR